MTSSMGNTTSCWVARGRRIRGSQDGEVSSIGINAIIPMRGAVHDLSEMSIEYAERRLSD